MDAVAKPGADEDMADGMQCTDHPFRTNPGGICAFCLQEKLGKLVSSSLPLPLRPSSSSSPPSPSSFRSDVLPSASSSSASRPSASAIPTSSSSSSSAKRNEYYTRRARFPSLLTRKKHKKKASGNASSSSSSAPATSDVIFKRSKSTATPRRGKFCDDPEEAMVMEDFSPRKRHGFWSFLHLSSRSSVSGKKLDGKSFRDGNDSPGVSMINNGKQKEKCMGSSLGKKSDIVIVEEDDTVSASASASASSFERKVSRSRSVGCGSRSFSGDFFERISTGFGDCALRRVESQREGKTKVAARGGGDNHHHSIKERVRCAGLFSGFMMNSSSSSSSSSSYLVSSSTDDHHHHNNSNNNMNTKPSNMALSHNRAGRNWVWAFASPMRAFSTKPSNSKDMKNTATPNLSAVPSLLAVRG